MHRSLLLLSKLRLLGQARKMRHALATPKGILMTVAAVAFFVMAFGPYFAMRIAARGLPREAMPTVDWVLHPATLFVFWLLTLAGNRFKSPLAFSMAEVDFLFPGPFLRRQLLVYKLAVSGFGTLGFALVMPLFIPVAWWAAALVGLWLAATFMQWSSILVTLAADWIGARYRLLRWLAAAAVLGAAGVSIWRAGVFATGVELRERLLALESSGTGQIVLAPFVVFSRLISSGGLDAMLAWGSAALAMVLGVAGAILLLDAHFIETSLDASRKRYEALQRLKRAGGMPTIGTRSKPRFGVPPFPRLGGAGAIAWRQTLEMLRGSGRLVFVALPLFVPFAMSGLAANQGDGTASTAIFVALTMLIGFLICTIMPLGLRTDLDHIDVIKTLPIAAATIVWGSIGSAIAYITLVQLIALAGLTVVVGAWTSAASLALALAVPINLLAVASDSVLVLLFPTVRHFAPGDVMVGVRMVLVNFAKFVFALAAASLAAAMMLIAWYLFGERWPLLAAVGFVVLLAEGLAAVWLAARLFERFDPSAHSVQAD